MTWVGEVRYELAEGPRWNPATHTVSFVDIEGKTLTIAKIDGDGLVAIDVRLFDQRIGFALPFDDNCFLVAQGDRVAVSSPDGIVEVSRPLLAPGRRLNDATIDPAGRLVAGGMSLGAAPTDNWLVRLEQDSSVSVIDDDLVLSNGIGFSPDGTTLYSVDSGRGVVFERRYDSFGTAIGERTTFATVSDCDPDGLAVDASGDVWVALWGGRGLRRFRPDGAVVGDVPMGPPHVTSLAFVGQDLDRALVTTAMLLLDDQERTDESDAGRIRLVDLGVTGLAPTAWSPVDLPF